MTATRWILIAVLAVLLALLGGVQLGRATAPVRTVERIETVTDEKVTTLAYTGALLWTASTRTVWRDRIRRVVWRPDGTVEQDERDVQGEAIGSASGQATVALQAATQERHEEARREEVTERPAVTLPRLFVGALARPDLRGGLAVASLRLVGPVWVTGAATYEHGEKPAVWLGGGWSW